MTQKNETEAETGEQKEGGNWFKFFFPDVPAAVAQGRLPLKFHSLHEVAAWAKSHKQDGETALRLWLTTEGVDDLSRRLVTVWIEQAGSRSSR
ncbi:hypothetical protein QRO11_09490 [Paracidovorax citrulli]|uniref:hypothetical protein n=1 Tax=Paracidovorax citrulli TaxID=80869 RepID=UPI000882F58E|nr:hypothetical protein [Paracidovorax citrulli]UEG48015.1 hypothetical protein LKW27_09255 [Paracidovorax citrulli]UMT88740.1 hypothetical protein FRC90_12145 [Paracidovorax citrulli]UMT96714.1 hypothetical protein FRC97_17920 [Paracidovorax citrulli]WIY36528.1 hypothetical protein QRO11_09490 [Paracidovorax citrulli]SDJ91320.1 hypothetical protein SAMN04489709_1096 [Paracidovorax citrulli]